MDLNNRFIVFDRTALSDHPRLQSIYYFLINYSVQRRMKQGLKAGLNQYVVNEEISDLLIDEQSASLLSENYRTARKYGTIHFSVTQMISDFTQNNYTKAILANSYIKFILHLDSEYELLSVLGLNDNEIDSVKNLKTIPKKYSEIFVKYGMNTSFVLKIEPSKLDYEICATDKQSYTRYHEYYDRGAVQLFDKIKDYAHAK